MSLREQQRSKRQRAILLAAAESFKRKGIDGSKMEEIAAAAQVSPGTLYNYFPSKDELVRSLTELYRLDVSQQREAVLENPELKPQEAFCELYRLWIDGAEKYLSRDVWRYGQVVGLISNMAQPRHVAWLNELELIDAQEQLLKFHVGLSNLPETIDARAWAYCLHAVGFFWWMYYLGNDAIDSQFAKERISEQFELLFKSIQVTPVKPS